MKTTFGIIGGVLAGIIAGIAIGVKKHEAIENKVQEVKDYTKEQWQKLKSKKEAEVEAEKEDDDFEPVD